MFLNSLHGDVMVQRRPPTHSSLLRFLRITAAQVDAKAWAAWVSGNGERRMCVANAAGDTFWRFESVEDAWRQWQASARTTRSKRLHIEALANHFMASRGIDRQAWDAWLASPLIRRYNSLPEHSFEIPLPEPPSSAAAVALPRGWVAVEARAYAERSRDVFLQMPYITAVPGAIEQKRHEQAKGFAFALRAALDNRSVRSSLRRRL